MYSTGGCRSSSFRCFPCLKCSAYSLSPNVRHTRTGTFSTCSLSSHFLADCVWAFLHDHGWEKRGLYTLFLLLSIARQLILMTAVRFWARVCMYIYIYMYTLLSRFIKERNKVSTASANCCEHRRAAWLIPKMADCGEDQCKSRQDQKRKQRQSMSEGIIKKVKGNDAKQRLAKQSPCMENHRVRETGKQRYQQVISI